jgi:membrane protein
MAAIRELEPVLLLNQRMFAVMKQAIMDFVDEDCTTMAAALAYYTVFSLPPLLALVVATAGVFFGSEAVQRAVEVNAGQLIGPSAAAEIRTMMEQSRQSGDDNWWKVLVGVGALIFGATTAFAQLQMALNRAWGVQPNPRSGRIITFLGKRLLSFGFVLILGFLLLVSMVLTAAVTALGNWAVGDQWLAEGPLLRAIDFSISLLVIALLFAAMFRYLPDARIQWGDVSMGAVLTALLFVIGKFLLGIYIGASDPGKAYGTAGSIILVFVWIYYSSMIVLLGAEFTQAWAASHGRHIVPNPGAIKSTPHVA